MDYKVLLKEEFGIDSNTKTVGRQKKSDLDNTSGFKNKLTGKWVYRWNCINSIEFENIYNNMNTRLENIKVD